MLVKQVWAAFPTPTPCPQGVGVCIHDIFAPAKKFGDLGELVSALSKNIVLLAGMIFFILILIAGFGVIQAAGSSDAKEMEKNKSYLTYAVIGFVIIFGAYWVLQIINAVLGGSLGDLFK